MKSLRDEIRLRRVSASPMRPLDIIEDRGEEEGLGDRRAGSPKGGASRTERRGTRHLNSQLSILNSQFLTAKKDPG